MIGIKACKPYEKYGAILGKMRREAGLTQEAAAEMLDISTRVLQMYELGERIPRLNIAVKMSKIYGFALTEFSSAEDECE